MVLVVVWEMESFRASCNNSHHIVPPLQWDQLKIQALLLQRSTISWDFLAALVALYLTLVSESLSDCHFRILTQRVDREWLQTFLTMTMTMTIDHWPSTNDQRPTTNRPTTIHHQLTTNDQQPTNNDQRPTDQWPITNDQQPKTKDKQQTTNDQRPTTND